MNRNAVILGAVIVMVSGLGRDANQDVSPDAMEREWVEPGGMVEDETQVMPGGDKDAEVVDQAGRADDGSSVQGERSAAGQSQRTGLGDLSRGHWETRNGYRSESRRGRFGRKRTVQVPIVTRVWVEN